MEGAHQPIGQRTPLLENPLAAVHPNQLPADATGSLTFGPVSKRDSERVVQVCRCGTCRWEGVTGTDVVSPLLPSRRLPMAVVTVPRGQAYRDSRRRSSSSSNWGKVAADQSSVTLSRRPKPLLRSGSGERLTARSVRLPRE